jgi:hypothetical protein
MTYATNFKVIHNGSVDNDEYDYATVELESFFSFPFRPRKFKLVQLFRKAAEHYQFDWRYLENGEPASDDIQMAAKEYRIEYLKGQTAIREYAKATDAREKLKVINAQNHSNDQT